MDTSIAPLISGGRSGPLGVAHLPRFWLKMRLHDAGALPEGYRHGTGGHDELLLAALGLDAVAFAAYIAAATPDYQQCETWVRANARDLAPATLRAFNETIVTAEMPEPRRGEWSARFGLAAGTYVLGIRLNSLDDWDLVHEQLKAPGAPTTPVVPAISSADAGPLGALHLPRLWLKHRLHGVGRLPAGYRHGTGGFDEMVSDGLGFDPAAFAGYVETEQPDYLAAEAWVRRTATALDAASIAALNARIVATNLPPEKLAERRAELGLPADSPERSIPLNDLDDWAALYRQLQAVAH